MDVMDAYEMIYSDPRHNQRNTAKPSGESYTVEYDEDGKIKVTSTPKGTKKSKKKKKNAPSTSGSQGKSHPEAEFTNSTVPVRDFDRRKAQLAPPSLSQSEVNFLAEKSSETNIRQRPGTAEANLNMLKNSSNDDTDETSSFVSLKTVTTEYNASELSESNPDLISMLDSENELHRTSSRKSVAFKSNLVETSSAPVASEQERESRRKTRSPSPKSLLKKYQPQPGNPEGLNEPGMTLVQTLNHIGRTKRSRASTPSAPKPLTFGEKRSKIPILIPRFSKPLKPFDSDTIESENTSATNVTRNGASNTFQKIGISRAPRKTSKEGRKRKESVERMLKSNGEGGGGVLPHSYADQVMVSQNYIRRMIKAGGKPSSANSSSASLSNQQSRMSLATKLSSSTGFRSESQETSSSTQLPFKAPSAPLVSELPRESNEESSKDSSEGKTESQGRSTVLSEAEDDGESTTVVFKTDHTETFATLSVIENQAGKSFEPPQEDAAEFAQGSMSKHNLPPPPQPPLPALEVTLPLSHKEVTLSPVLTDESARGPELQSGMSKKEETSFHSSPKKSELKKVTGIITPCRFHTAGCPAELPRGTLKEEEHTQKCKYRPLPCLFSPGACDEIVPYHNFLLHQQRHFLVPNFTRSCSTQVVIAKEDFEYNQNWLPKWMSWDGQHFFLMLNHRRGKSIGRTGTWVCWIQMFGTPDEAAEYFYDIEIYKGANKKIGGTFTTQSIRSPVTDVQKTESGLVFSDLQIKKISGIGDFEKKDFFIDVVISKKPECDTAILKYTGSYTTPEDDPADEYLT